MNDANRQYAIDKALVIYWKEKIDYWIIRREFDLKKDSLDRIGLECYIDVLTSTPYHLGRLRQRLLALGATEEEMANPGFFQASSESQDRLRNSVELAKELAATGR